AVGAGVFSHLLAQDQFELAAAGPGLGDNFDPRYPTHRSVRHPTGLHNTAGYRLTLAHRMRTEEVTVTTRTHFTFRVDTWTPDGESIVEHIAGSDLATAAKPTIPPAPGLAAMTPGGPSSRACRSGTRQRAVPTGLPAGNGLTPSSALRAHCSARAASG